MRRGRVSLPILEKITQAADTFVFLLTCIITYTTANRPDMQGATRAILFGEVGGFWIAAACLSRFGGYRLLSIGAQFRAILLAVTCSSVALTLVLWACCPRPADSLWALLWAGSALILLGVERCTVALLVLHLKSAGQLERRIALLGYSNAAALLFHAQPAARRSITRIAGAYYWSMSESLSADAAIPVLGGIEELCVDSQCGEIDAIVVTLPTTEVALIGAILNRLQGIVAEIYLLADPARPGRVSMFRGIALKRIVAPPLSEWQWLQKTIFDYICSALLIVFLSPILLGIAVLIKLDSEGPILFLQKRTGYSNIPFCCFKFRTMYWHLSDAFADRQTTRHDMRVTRVGRWLRRFSLDELPQLFNVLRGDMSLVGPRPHAPLTKMGNQLIAEVVDDYARRHRIKPGITGWAQVNGWRGEIRTEQQICERVRHDLHYIENWSMRLDFRILIMTLWRGVFSDQAY
jgi:polysaccharide biosynthesis protein PslA